jgi:predicted permease
MTPEHWFRTIPLRLRSLFRRRQVEEELDEELQIHLEQLIKHETASGKTPTEARHAALRAMGGLEQQKEECRDARRVGWLEELMQDTRYAARTLAKTPGFTVISLLVLTLGIGSSTAIFTLVNSVLLRPLPFPAANQLFLVSDKPRRFSFFTGPGVMDRSYLAFRKRNQCFESLATVNREKVTLTGSGEPVVLTAGMVSPDFLRVLRVPPAIGREFAGEGRTEGNVTLLSNSLWRSRFGSKPNVVGKSIVLDGLEYTVAGVMPAFFTFQSADLWIRNEIRLDPHNAYFLPVIGRLRPGVSPRQAQAELEAFAGSEGKREEYLTGILPLKELFVAGARKRLLMFTGAVALVFLIACANFANLLLIRGSGRRAEIAMRAALGAGRWRLIRQLLAESALLSLAGATSGLLFSMAAVRLLLAVLSAEQVPAAGGVRLDSWVVTFTFCLALVTGLIFGLLPALQATRRELREGISEGGRNRVLRRERFRAGLVIAEIALALVLLMGAGLLLRSFVRLRSVNPGFEPAKVVAATVDLPGSRYQTAAQMRALDEHVLRLLARLPGARAVAAVSWLPFDFGVRGDFQFEDGRRLPEDYRVDKPVISADYFRTVGIRLLSGRRFSERDRASGPGVVILSESVARRFWPRGDAIGKRISMEDRPKPGDWLTIVGIVSDVRQQNLAEKPGAAIYLPYQQVSQTGFLGHMSFVVQASGNAAALFSGVRAAIHKADRDLPTQSVTTMDSIVASSLSEQRAQTLLLGIFSLMALLVAAIGIYGVLASSVAERTHEIGIRMAVGATQQDVIWIVLRRTLVLAGSGVVLGGLGTLLVARALTRFLFEVSPDDPVTFFAVSSTLVVTALVAAWMPVRHAARIYPLIALRHE